MQQVILILGPSGVGKTTAHEPLIPRFSHCIFRHLDGLASDYAQARRWIPNASVGELARWAKDDGHFLAVGLQAVAALAAEYPGSNIVIDVGAGFLRANYSTRLPLMYRSIALTCDDLALERRRAGGKTTGDGKRVHAPVSAQNREVFNRCEVIIDTTHDTLDETAEKLASALESILGANPV